MNPVTAACRAMGTRFEIVLWGREESHLRAAGEEALAEIQRLDAQLSLYQPDSDTSELNARAAHAPVPVDPRLFRLLQLSQKIHQETNGAFDVTLAPIMRAWGLSVLNGKIPSEEELQSARECAGMQFLELNEGDFTVRFAREGMMLDLGAIGKGYAIERAAEIIRECGVGGGLIHGGTSTVQAIGTQPDGSPWQIAVKHPFDEGNALLDIPLPDGALSVSGIHGKGFRVGGRYYGHVLDPRTGAPAHNAVLALVLSPSATESDALSTALLVEGPALFPLLEAARPEARALVAVASAPSNLVLHRLKMEA